jgi:hypothetical protein
VHAILSAAVLQCGGLLFVCIWRQLYVIISLRSSCAYMCLLLTPQVWDNDGEFLLIEAAYALPRWLSPENATSRVWLRSGALHVVPLPSAKNPDLPAFPTLAQAHKVYAGAGRMHQCSAGMMW